MREPSMNTNVKAAGKAKHVAKRRSALRTERRKIGQRTLGEKIREFRRILNRKVTERHDVTYPLRLGQMALEALKEGEIQDAIEWLDEAITTLKALGAG
jgi:hypothetical protein